MLWDFFSHDRLRAARGLPLDWDSRRTLSSEYRRVVDSLGGRGIKGGQELAVPNRIPKNTKAGP
jgi:hypothetical protein